MYLEFLTVEKMIIIFCRDHHQTRDSLCDECKSLLEYSFERNRRCPFFENKIACSKCHIHCYQEPFKSKILPVMRYSGPRMILYHPLLAIRHLWCKLRKPSK